MKGSFPENLKFLKNTMGTMDWKVSCSTAQYLVAEGAGGRSEGPEAHVRKQKLTAAELRVLGLVRPSLLLSRVGRTESPS